MTSVPTENAWAVKVFGELLFVADGAGGLKIIDISQPLDPSVIGMSQTSGTAKDVAMEPSGNFVFVAVGAGGVDMINVSDPANPYVAVNYNTTGYASRVAVSGNIVAVSDWDDVEVLQWGNDPSLTLAGYKNSGGRVMAINMVDDVIFSAEWRFFRTFRFGEIEDPDIDLSRRVIDFPHTEIGECRESVLEVMNNGLSQLIINNVFIDHEDYSLNMPVESISPGEYIEAEITYCAASESGNAAFGINTNDPDESFVEVTLEGNSTWGLEAGEEAPDFSLSSVNGFGNITLSELEGRVVVIAFFASW